MMGKNEVWIGLAELRALPDCDLLAGAAGAFANIVTWAGTAEEFRSKVETLASSYALFVVHVEGEEPIAAREASGVLNPDIEELAHRAEANPKAILLGTLQKYEFDEA